MEARPRIGVMGAGAVGCYLGGRLLAAGTAEVRFVGRASIGRALEEHGLTVDDFGQARRTVPPGAIAFSESPRVLASCDVVLCATKSRQTDEAGRALAEVLGPGAIVVSMQNGLGNAAVLRRHLPPERVLAGIVGFNVVWGEAGVFRRATSGPLTVERSESESWRRAAAAIRAAGLDLVERRDIVPDQWTKLLLNLNNAVSALSGAPTQALILEGGYRRLVAAVMEEGYRVARAQGARPAPMKGISMRVLPKLLRLPTPLVRLLARRQIRVDPSARSSMWEDLQRGRPTEVDYLNGEIVRLAEATGAPAPLNRRVVELVKEAERAAKGSPGFLPDELWARIEAPRGPA